jgi:hypothetical protein
MAKMNAAELLVCMDEIDWNAEILARRFKISSQTVRKWMVDQTEIPTPAADWLYLVRNFLRENNSPTKSAFSAHALKEQIETRAPAPRQAPIDPEDDFDPAMHSAGARFATAKKPPSKDEKPYYAPRGTNKSAGRMPNDDHPDMRSDD